MKSKESSEQQSEIQQTVTENKGGKRLMEWEVTMGSATQRSKRMGLGEMPVGPPGAVLLAFWRDHTLGLELKG